MIRAAANGSVSSRPGLGSVILAAGDSRRMGHPKALLTMPAGDTFLSRVLDCHRTISSRRVVVVGTDADRIIDSCSAPVEWLTNRRPDRGPLSSLLLALGRLESSTGVIVHSVDHPLVKSTTLSRLAEVHERRPDCILVPECHGVKGHPVLFPARFFPELRKAPLEVGARAVTRRHSASIHRVIVSDRGITGNINTPDAYARLWGERRPHPPLAGSGFSDD